MFFKGSRYEKVKEYDAKDAQGNIHKVKQIRPIEKLEKAFNYVVQEGDRLDNLAYKFYNDSTKFWLICDTNANIAMSTYDLMIPGKTIIIPKESIG
jgi:nucleoid-associated protein YgaU